ncbi:MAG: hypothetical protein WC449_05335 [Candidatus Paceibacterota bacterium]
MENKKDNGFVAAIIPALQSGNLENIIAASAPGGIEAQEARGQQWLVASRRLPRKWQGARDIARLEELGFTFTDNPQDKLFLNATFPAGWSLQPTNHSMWNQLIDDKGKKMASIFYKAAFYDRDAFGRFEEAE